MKKITATVAIILMALNVLHAQYQEVIDLEAFNAIELDGNIRLYLQQGNETSVAIKTRKAENIEKYKIAVHEGTLYVRRRDRWSSKSPKITLYLKHSGLEKVDMDGFIKIITVDALKGDQLMIKGDGFIKGDLEVDVKSLKVDVDGFCSLSIFGDAGAADLRVDGIGKIKAHELETSSVSKSTQGIASIRVGH